MISYHPTSLETESDSNQFLVCLCMLLLILKVKIMYKFTECETSTEILSFEPINNLIEVKMVKSCSAYSFLTTLMKYDSDVYIKLIVFLK